MSHVTRCLVWLLAVASLLATPAMAGTLQCADQDELSSCTPPAIWASFQAVYRDGSEDWIDSYLSQTEQRDLVARLKFGQAPTAAAEHWEEKLPPAAAIVWLLLTGKLSAIAAADAKGVDEARAEAIK